MNLDRSTEHSVKCIVCGTNQWHNVPSVTRVIRSMFEPNAVVQCTTCGLGRLEHMPDQNAINAIYANPEYVDSYDEAGQEFVVSAESASEQLRPRFDLIRSFLPSAGTILDIGASRGFFLNEAKKHGWDIHGIEAGRDSIEFAKRTFDIIIQHGTIESVNFPEGFFDCVHMSHVMEHLRDPDITIARIARWLKPGGVLVVEVPYEFGDLFDTIRERFLGRPRAINSVPSSHLYFFTLSSLSALLEKLGFEVLAGSTPRRNASYESRLPMGTWIKKCVYGVEKRLKMGPLIEVYARKK